MTDVRQVTLVRFESNFETLYHLKRSTTPDVGFTMIASTTGSIHPDTSVVNGTIYYFPVSAESAAGESADSPQASAKPHAPFAPGGLVPPAVILSDETTELTVRSVAGGIYQLQRNETLVPEAWESTGDPLTGTGTAGILADPDAFSLPKCIYRLRIQP